MIKNIEIKTDMIQLDQFLKWADVIESGGQIRPLLDEKRIFCQRHALPAKRKQLHAGDIVDIKGIGTYKLTGE